MQTATIEIESELSNLEAQKINLEAQLSNIRAETARHTIRRREISAKAFLGNSEAQRELETYTSTAVRQAHEEENIGFAIEELTAQIKDAKEKLIEAIETQKQARLKSLANERIEKTETLPDAMANAIGILADCQAIDAEIERLTGHDKFEARSGSYSLENFIAARFTKLFPGIPFGRIDHQQDLIETTRKLFARFIE